MTQTPAAATAPVPATVPAAPAVSNSLELKPGTTPTPVQGAAISTAQWTGKLLVGPSEHPDRKVAYDLVPSLSALDMVLLQEAQDTGKFRELIGAIRQLVPASQRDALVAQMLTEPEHYEDRMTLDDCMEVLANGLEQIAARPTGK